VQDLALRRQLDPGRHGVTAGSRDHTDEVPRLGLVEHEPDRLVRRVESGRQRRHQQTDLSRDGPGDNGVEHDPAVERDSYLSQEKVKHRRGRPLCLT
jgi:hypothetical protein